MESKLIKTDGSYCLTVIHERVGKMIIGTDNKELNKMLNYPHNLSLKNCEAIENGYDLDELATKNAFKDLINGGYDGLINPHTKMLIDVSYMNGFQKALELLGDKKFSEDDMYEAIRKAKSYDEIPNHEGVIVRFNYLKEEIIQSLQQTEWDVIVKMEYIGECNGNNDDGCFQESPGHNCGCIERKPKLDADGCLILKRK